MKLAGATLMRCLLLGVMLLMGASMKTMKEIGQALSMDGSFFDHGLGGDDLNLQVIESSLMSMVREGTSPSLRPGIVSIKDLTTDMKAAIENKTTEEQSNMTDAWYVWLNCSAHGDTIPDNGTTSLLDEHCVHTYGSGLVDWEGNPFNGTVSEWAYTHCRQNCTQLCENDSVMEREIMSCPQTPFSCEKQWAAFDDNTDVRDHMAYLQSVFAAKKLIETNCSDPPDPTNCTSRCVLDCPGDYNRTNLNCSRAMCEIENRGCHYRNRTCEEYWDCYDREEAIYYQTKNWASSQEDPNKQEYRAILRIECLLDKFLASIDNNTSLSDGINLCINRTFETNDSTRFGNVTIGYYNESENPKKSCTAENFPNANPPLDLEPGSPAWNERYYSAYAAAGFGPPVCRDDPSLRALIPVCLDSNYSRSNW
jgi:hypothetical protein